jgi:protein SCO1
MGATRWDKEQFLNRNGHRSAPWRRQKARGAVFIGGLGLAVLLGLAALAGCGGDGGDSAARGGSANLQSLPGAIYDPPRPAPALRLTGADGNAFDLASERGHVTLVFFGFTACPDLCPTTLHRWAEVHAALGADTALARFVFVSTDPEHDTPAAAAAYARKFGPSFVGLSGTEAEIRQIALAWSVPMGRSHSAQVFVVDREGLIPWGYGRDAETASIVRGIRMLAR